MGRRGIIVALGVMLGKVGGLLIAATRKHGRLFAVASAVTVLVAAFGLPASASASASPPAAASSAVSLGLPSWSGYIRSTDGVRLWVHSVGGGVAGARVIVLVHGGPGLSLGYLSISTAWPVRPGRS